MFLALAPSGIDWGPAATLFAAVVGGGFLLYRQVLQWRETRRDRVRDAYADWLGKVMILHRKDERVMEVQTFLNMVLQAHVAAGGVVGPGGAIPVSPELERMAYSARREQHAAQFEEGQTFSKIALLDNDPRRVERAQQVKQMVSFVDVEDGQPPNVEHFDRVQREKAEALGWLAHDINLSSFASGTRLDATWSARGALWTSLPMSHCTPRRSKGWRR